MIYMHIVLFAICLNFGLGIAHIPGTPISLSDATTTQDISCFNDFEANGMLTYVNATDASGNPTGVYSGLRGDYDPNYVWTNGFGETVTGGYPNAVDVGMWVPTSQTDTILDLNQNVNSTGYDPITQSVEQLYQAGETFKNFVAGGYVVNILDHISLTCDFDPESATFGQAVDTAVWQYFKGGIMIIFTMLTILTILYLVTGKSFGI